MRGGARRRYIEPGIDADVWCRSGRWGCRRTRVSECWALVSAENVYTEAIRANAVETCPGARGEATFRAAGREFGFAWEVRANAVWRFGRLFLHCPRCERRATRLYVPTADAWLACRRCWGLSYSSQKNSYRWGGFLFELLGSWGESETALARKRRRVASSQRYGIRREILGLASPRACGVR